MIRQLLIVLALIPAVPLRGTVAADEENFLRQVAPILARNCLECHGGDRREGSFSVATRDDFFRGGDSGTAVERGSLSGSRLLELIEPHDGRAEMPQGRPPLSAEERRILREWIAAGAAWPAEHVLRPNRMDVDWWSWKPVRRVEAPVGGAGQEGWLRSPVDAFIIDQLMAQGLKPAPEADRRTLYRRLSYDLLGLPPDPIEVEAFVRDNDPGAYERLVDRLLASPHYGERWARHWLDVVHYGETHGYDKDKPRANAWPYRDYVIRAFNDDRPYARFVQEQVAGDVLFPDTADGIVALGFLAAGPWDFIGHAEVPETKTDGKIARHLDRDDMIANLMGTFCSVTVHCAQCHDHKFDPIPQVDYYNLQAVVAALDRTDREYEHDPATGARRRELQNRGGMLREELAGFETRLREAGGSELAELDRRLELAKRPASERPPQHGYHSALEPRDDVAKWVQVDLGSAQDIDTVVLTGCFDDFAGIGAGFGFPRQFRIDVADDAEFGNARQVVFDTAKQDYANPGTVPQTFSANGLRGRFVRVTATRLAHRQNDYMLALAELDVRNRAGESLSLKRDVTALDSIEAPIRWSRANLVDGLAPGNAVSPSEVARLQDQRLAITARVMPRAELQRLQTAGDELEKVAAALKSLPPASKVYAGGVHFGSGTFTGTGPTGGKPRAIHVLARGNVQMPREEAVAGALSAISTIPARFDVAANAPEGERRRALALWLTDHEHPLLWRSMANRLWQYHFGRGLVETANDFGRMGQQPTHPDLLDWLANELRDGQGSLKPLQRAIVLSSTYRQQSDSSDEARQGEIDRENRLLWKFPRRRLSAEEVRDSLLIASGQWDDRMGGASFQDFVIEHPEHSPHYQYEQFDPSDARGRRRTIYRFIVRSRPQPFLATWDCADPSLVVEKRNETMTPQQALALLNDKLAVQCSELLAERARVNSEQLEEQARTLVRWTLAREAEREEVAMLAKLAAEHGLAHAARVVLNLNEFVFVD